MRVRLSSLIMNSYPVRFFRSYAWALVFYIGLYAYGCFRFPFDDRIQVITEVIIATCAFGVVLLCIWLNKKGYDHNIQSQWSHIVTLGLITTTALIISLHFEERLYWGIGFFVSLMLIWVFSPTHRRVETRSVADYQTEMIVGRFIALGILFLAMFTNVFMLLSEHREIAEAIFMVALGFAAMFLFVWGMLLNKGQTFSTFIEECLESLFEFTPLFVTVTFVFQHMELWKAVLLSLFLIIVRGYAPYRCWFWSQKSESWMR